MDDQSGGYRSAAAAAICVLIKHGKAQLWLVGISDFWEGPHDVKGAMSQITHRAPVVLFTHNPDVFPMVTGRFSLLIAGHTHGGQVYLPMVGRPIIVPSRFGQRYAAGHIVENGQHLFVRRHEHSSRALSGASRDHTA